MPITDEESLRRWLEGRPREDAQAIATRAALRVFPLWGRAMDGNWARNGDLTALPILRLNLNSGAARKSPSEMVREASEYAASAARAAAARATAARLADGAGVAAARLSGTAHIGQATAAAYAATAAADTNASSPADNSTATKAAIASARSAAMAATDDDAAVMSAINGDADAMNQNKDPFTAPLWPDTPPDWFTTADTETRAIWATDPLGRWDFWTRWWDGILAGTPIDWNLQRDIALIPDADWQQGPDHIARLISGIEERYRPKPTSALESAVLRLALTDFTFNDLRTFLRMVPFESDLSVVRDPARLARFAEDAEDLRDALADFTTVANVGKNQNAKQVAGLLSRLSVELDRTGTVGTLRVGRLIDLGAQVQNACLNENLRIGLGDILFPSLEIVADRLLKLSRDYFPLALDRLEPLKQARFLPEEDPSRIIAQLRHNLDGIRKVQDGQAVPLDPADIAVLSDVLEELERVNFAYQTTSDPAVRAELGIQLARKTAQTGVTFARYWIVARTAKDSAVKGLDWVIGWFKRYETVQKIIDALEPLWNSGSPPN